ncbi:MAG TPA: T9SS type A sorting domain-containing protein [Cryomorphaceae bacterium]|nr:T9SS type A sorting domain-containing protein [Cryomorphaceae bacterium]
MKNFLSPIFAVFVFITAQGQSSNGPLHPAAFSNPWFFTSQPTSPLPDRLLPTKVQEAPTTTFGTEDLHARPIGIMTKGYDGTGFNFLFDSTRYHWSGDANQSNIDTVIIRRSGAPFPFTPLNDLGFTFATFVFADSLTGAYFDGMNALPYRETHVLDKNGYLSESILRVYDSGQWTGMARRAYTFDDQSNNTEAIAYNPAGDEWVEVMKWNYDFDADNRLTDLHVEVWQDGQWVDYSHFRFEYENGLWVGETREAWEDGEWVISMRIELYYDENESLTSYTQMEWVNGDWVNLYGRTFEYDGGDRVIARTERAWEDGHWLVLGASEFMYDEDGNLTGSTLSMWDVATDTLENIFLFAYEYNEFGRVGRISSQSWNGTHYEYTAFSDAEVIIEYEEMATSTDDRVIDASTIQLYPNPSDEVLHIKLENSCIDRIEVFNITGKSVYQTLGGGGATEFVIPTTPLIDGIYVLRVECGRRTGRKTFAVSR